MKVSVTNTVLENIAISANGQSGVFSKQWATELRLSVKTTGKTSSPTLTVFIESSPNNLDWFPVDNLAITADGNNIKNATNFGKYVRLRWTITGGSFTGVSIWVTYKNA